MTLCVALEARRGRTPCVLIGHDWKGGSDLAAAETQHKVLWGANNTPILIAGHLSKANELASLVHEQLESSTDDLHTFDRLKEAVRLRKRSMAAEYIAAHYGMTYQEFLVSAKTALPESAHKAAIEDIRRMTLDCALIVVTRWEGDNALFRITETGEVELCAQFCAIGDGMYGAESLLAYRAHSDRTQLGKSMYHIYEAWDFGGVAPSVGKKYFSVGIATWRRGKYEIEEMTEAGKQELSEQTFNFGLGKLPNVPVPKHFLRKREI